MAEEYSLEVMGQKYFGCERDRTFRLYFTVPEKQGQAGMGLCLLIAGFGGHANAKVYRKMRRKFADRENLVVIQCDYFGYEFMMQEINIDFQMEMFFSEKELLSIRNGEYDFSSEEIKACTFKLAESKENFCEMGLFQAMDNLRAVKVVMDILEQNHIAYDNNKIICYGHSQGAYLAYLCNAFFPNLFSCIIDNSAWLYPKYFMWTRRIGTIFFVPDEAHKTVSLVLLGDASKEVSNTRAEIYIEYQLKDFVDDVQAYLLPVIYLQIKNQTRIISFHGEKDTLAPIEEKVDFIKSIPNALLNIVREKDIDSKVFKNAEHGLGADYLKLFYGVCGKYSLKRETRQGDLWKGSAFATDSYTYDIMLEEGVPEIKRGKSPQY